MNRGQLYLALLLSILAGACGSTSVENVTGPGAVRCAASLTADPATAPADGTAVAVTVSAARDCAWNARTDVSWIQVRSASGQGSGTFTTTVARNDLPSPRSGGIIVNDQRLGITQEGRACTFALGGTNEPVAPTGGRGTVTVSTSAGCAWSAASSASWLVMLTASGSGPGTIPFDVAPNTGPTREATITVGGRSIVITQTAAVTAPPCTFTIEPTTAGFPVAGGQGSVSVTAGATCAWSVEGGSDWISVVGGSGTGSGTARYTVAANAATTPRTATLTIAGRVHTVTQVGVTCTYVLTPNAGSFPAGGGASAVQVQTLPGCAWTASSNAGWATITTTNGAGSGTVPYTVLANADPNPRTASILIAGQVHSITQDAAAPPCAYVLEPPSQSLTAAAQSASVHVATAGSCAWTASSGAPWITVAQATGTGPADVGYTVAENTTAASRIGVITIAGQTHTVTQGAAAPACAYALDPSERPLTAAAQTAAVRVNTGLGCAWTASSGVPWITIGQANGTGSADVTYNVAENTTAVARSGVVTIAGQTHTVVQAGAVVVACTYALDPAERIFASTGGTGLVRVTTGEGCGWNAVASAGWLNVTTPTGVGSSNVGYLVASAGGGVNRSASIVIGGEVHTVRQSNALAPVP